MRQELQAINQQDEPALCDGRIQEYRSSGHNVKEWGRGNGIWEQTYVPPQKHFTGKTSAILGY